MSIMDSFPEWSDDDSRELDDFLLKPWPDENTNSIRTNEEGWPEFSPVKFPRTWRQFSLNRTSKIASVNSVPSDDEEEHRDDYNSRNDWTDARDDDEESVVTLSSMAGATVELATTARQTTPPKPQRLLRQKLPMLLCKSERLKQPFPSDKRVRFAVHNGKDHVPEGEELALDPIIEIGVDTVTETIKPPHPVVLKPPRIQARPRPVVKKASPELCFQDAPLEAYSGKCSPSNWIHKANLFHDKTLPSNTLDLFCRDSALAGGSVPSVRDVSYSEEDTVTSSSSGSGVSSLPGGAVDEKLAHVFSLSSINEKTRAWSVRDYRHAATKTALEAGARDPPVPVRQQYHATYDTDTRNPPAQAHEYGAVFSDFGEEGLPTQSPNTYDHHEETASEVGYPDHETHAKFSHRQPSGSKVANRQKWLNEAFKRSKADQDGRPGVIPVSKVSHSIEKFGGRSTRQSPVQQKREELERKLALEKQKPSFKTKWEGRPGSYKKRVVLTSNY